MSVDTYRRQVSQHTVNIGKLQVEKGKVAKKVAIASKKSLDAQIAAGKSKSLSTVSSKLKEAQRYAVEEAKAQQELGKLETKIASEQTKLIAAKNRLDQEEAREQKKKQNAQTKADLDQDRRMRGIRADLARHDNLHAETQSSIKKLTALPEKITVAFFASDPGSNSATRLALDEEVRSIGMKIRASDHRDSVKLESRWAVRPGDILQAINELKPTVIHFSGHGSSADELVLQDDNGSPKFVPMPAIVQAMALASETVKLVFFNTCYSYNQAEACAEHVSAAIGMNDSIGDEAARVFSAQFYSAIGFGLSINKAFQQAKAALMLEGIAEESTPELYMRNGEDEVSLTLVKPPSGA
ncbi:hypothetical protein [Pseudomonas chlororaphis]